MCSVETQKLTNQQLEARAIKAGWEWVENSVGRFWWSSTKHPATGWLQPQGSFLSCYAKDKFSRLRADETKPPSGFDHDLDCTDCGLPIWLNWIEHKERELVARRECFSCNFWLEIIRGPECLRMVNPNDGKVHHYTLGERTTPGQFNGFGGSKFTIRKQDGSIVTTVDLWHQGTVPDRFLERLPVNAEFV